MKELAKEKDKDADISPRLPKIYDSKKMLKLKRK